MSVSYDLPVERLDALYLLSSERMQYQPRISRQKRFDICTDRLVTLLPSNNENEWEVLTSPPYSWALARAISSSRAAEISLIITRTASSGVALRSEENELHK